MPLTHEGRLLWGLFQISLNLLIQHVMSIWVCVHDMALDGSDHGTCSMLGKMHFESTLRNVSFDLHSSAFRWAYAGYLLSITIIELHSLFFSKKRKRKEKKTKQITISDVAWRFVGCFHALSRVTAFFRCVSSLASLFPLTSATLGQQIYSILK